MLKLHLADVLEYISWIGEPQEPAVTSTVRKWRRPTQGSLTTWRVRSSRIGTPLRPVMSWA